MEKTIKMKKHLFTAGVYLAWKLAEKNIGNSNNFNAKDTLIVMYLHLLTKNDKPQNFLYFGNTQRY